MDPGMPDVDPEADDLLVYLPEILPGFTLAIHWCYNYVSVVHRNTNTELRVEHSDHCGELVYLFMRHFHSIKDLAAGSALTLKQLVNRLRTECRISYQYEEIAHRPHQSQRVLTDPRQDTREQPSQMVESTTVGYPCTRSRETLEAARLTRVANAAAHEALRCAAVAGIPGADEAAQTEAEQAARKAQEAAEAARLAVRAAALAAHSPRGAAPAPPAPPAPPPP